jgi:hypothetical protein
LLCCAGCIHFRLELDRSEASIESASVDKFKGEGEKDWPNHSAGGVPSTQPAIIGPSVRCFFAFNLSILRVQLVAVEEDDAGVLIGVPEANTDVQTVGYFYSVTALSRVTIPNAQI